MNSNPTELTIACASNFTPTLKKIASEFKNSHSDIKITIVSGSTGSLYAKIINHAPYDIFLSADKKRPQLLESNGIAIHKTRHTYAIGKLILWSHKNIALDINSLLNNKAKKYLLPTPLQHPTEKRQSKL